MKIKLFFLISSQAIFILNSVMMRSMGVFLFQQKVIEKWSPLLEIHIFIRINIINIYLIQNAFCDKSYGLVLHLLPSSSLKYHFTQLVCQMMMMIKFIIKSHVSSVINIYFILPSDMPPSIN